jgi:5-hydroxyisourate hydrolase-like protein (transthyretin family)
MGARGLDATGRAARWSMWTAALLVAPGVAFAQAPVVTTGSASAITQTSATLNGVVTSSFGNGQFEYGTTTAYGRSEGLSFLNWVEHPVSRTVSNLDCGTAYHFRLVGTNGSGTTYGEDASFATAGCSGISGTITSAATGLPLANIWVGVYDSNMNGVGWAVTDATGLYALLGPLPTGSYIVTANNDQGYVNELYDDKPCPGTYCDYTQATPVAVTVGSTTGGVDFALSPTARISGVVTDAATGAPLSGVRVQVLTTTNGNLGDVATDATGAYTYQSQLPAGSYKLVTYYNDRGYVDEVYDDHVCFAGYGNCPLASADLVAATSGATTSGIDFALAHSGRITGTITDADSGAPLPSVRIELYTAAGVLVENSVYTNGSGVYELKNRMPTGSYIVVTRDANGYVNEVYGGSPCVGELCDVSSGTPVGVTISAETPNVDFALHKGGLITGTVTEAATGNPIYGGGAAIEIYDASGRKVCETNAYTWGYVAPAGLPGGSYFVRTVGRAPFIDELYSNIPCPLGACTATDGTPVVVTPGSTTTGIDFALDLSGAIEGRVTSAQTGAAMAGVQVSIHSSTGALVIVKTTNSYGEYGHWIDLAAGSYFVRTTGTAGYTDELYDDMPCPGGACVVTSGTPVAVASGATTRGVDFALALAPAAPGSVGGTVTDAGTGLPLADVTVSVWDEGESLLASATTAANGSYLVEGVSAGTRFVRTANTLGYANELYDDLPCEPSCSVTSGTPVSVTSGSTASGIDFGLARIVGSIAGRVTGHAGPLAGVTVRAFDAAGQPAASQSTGADGSYLISVPPGSYFVATSNSEGYEDELFDNLPCPGGVCVVTSGTAVSVTAGATTSGVDFALAPAPGQVGGTVTDAATGLPLAGVSVSVWDEGASLLASATTAANGSYLVAGVSAGSRFVSTSNSLGYFDELYDNLPCDPSCPVTSGTPVSVARGSTTAGVDFALAESVPIAGAVTDDGTSSGIPGVTVTIYDGTGTAVGSAVTDGGGGYRVKASLPPGSYYVATSNALGYVDELYDDIVCPSGACTVTSGTPVEVVAGQTVVDVDFGLALAGSFYALPPCRVVDTRDPARGGPTPLAAGTERTLALAGSCAIPEGATALALNATATASSASGHLRLFPADRARPTVSTVNYGAGQTRANNAIIALSPSGGMTIYVGQPSGTVHVIVDVTGYFR